MKSIACVCVAALLLVSLALPSLTFAAKDGPSASGNFQFTLEEDGQTRNLEFHARVQNNGRTVGEMTFVDPSVVPVPDPDDPTAINSPGALITAKFDCLQITGNRAVMSGIISESNIAAAIGLRVLLDSRHRRVNLDLTRQNSLSFNDECPKLYHPAFSSMAHAKLGISTDE